MLRELPKYIQKAIASPTSSTAPYNLLNREQWRALAEHIYDGDMLGLRSAYYPESLFEKAHPTVKRVLDEIVFRSTERAHQYACKGKIPHLSEAKIVRRRLLRIQRFAEQNAILE